MTTDKDIQVLEEMRDGPKDLREATIERLDEKWARSDNTARFTDMLGEAFDAAHAAASAWVPVSERLPPEPNKGPYPNFLVSCDEPVSGGGVLKIVYEATLKDGQFYWDWDDKFTTPIKHIVAWMPLPTPYKGEQNNG